ncbi:uncharacterized protein JN550_007747 [Neoarthrinium moseri]|uniref:uncharacterized protein n=1 Tax=Neoarthrinium moseri TaxID=1658444 RepID=UPI001FDE5C4D|nr:uncharacterized protein JN550_007747 [Neoarthrinium moseri]KAI1866359.1 hypothetical protein JN550_007747 [Neoarthrinium moseri]
MKVQFAVGLAATFTGAWQPAAALHSPNMAAAPRRPARATGTGRQGVLLPDTDVAFAAAFAETASVQGIATTEEVDGVYGTCLVATNATISDCEAVIDDIAANSGNLSVAPGFCLNWWEGGCQGRVCGKNDLYEADAQSVASTMKGSILDTCIANGLTGVAADCADYKGSCGTYRLFLQTFAGI